MEPRKYTLKQRAERQHRTRVRIVDAAMALHEELGPASTTISAVAERAGVQRLTVYRHFSSDLELFTACTGKWLEQHPPPKLSVIEHDDPHVRTRKVLGALYRYYRRTARMWTVAYRDVDKVQALAAPMEAFAGYLAAIRKDLLKELNPPKTGKRQVGAALGHAVQFSTWQSLSEQRLTDAAIARLVTAWVLASFDER
jgi:AcrR family transcriptional regulator